MTTLGTVLCWLLARGTSSHVPVFWACGGIVLLCFHSCGFIHLLRCSHMGLPVCDCLLHPLYFECGLLTMMKLRGSWGRIRTHMVRIKVSGSLSAMAWWRHSLAQILFLRRIPYFGCAERAGSFRSFLTWSKVNWKELTFFVVVMDLLNKKLPWTRYQVSG